MKIALKYVIWRWIHCLPLCVTIVPSTAFTANDLPWSVLAVLMLYGGAYLANTGAVLFGKWIPKFTGMKVLRIDAGYTFIDGKRILGDGKTWNGFIGGGIFSGLLMMLEHAMWSGNSPSENDVFIDPLIFTYGNEWFFIGNEWGAAFVMGFVLGIGTMLGDSAGSFVKRRRGHIREGNTSSRALFLDTIPFAIVTFVFGLLFFSSQVIGDRGLILPMIILLFITPILHRVINILAFKLNLKDVPY